MRSRKAWGRSPETQSSEKWAWIPQYGEHDQDNDFRNHALQYCLSNLLTGSLVVGGAVALVEPAVNTPDFYFHERVWRVVDGRKMRDAAAKKPSSYKLAPRVRR